MLALFSTVSLFNKGDAAEKVSYLSILFHSLPFSPSYSPYRFVFLYNKGDTIVSDAEKVTCLSDLGRLLSVDVSFESKWLRPDGVFSSLPLARVSSFPPNPHHVEDIIGEERDLLMGQVFGLRKIANCPRIQVSSSACNIL